MEEKIDAMLYDLDKIDELNKIYNDQEDINIMLIKEIFLYNELFNNIYKKENIEPFKKEEKNKTYEQNWMELFKNEENDETCEQKWIELFENEKNNETYEQKWISYNEISIDVIKLNKNKKKIIKNLEKIIENLEHYKKIKSFLNLLEMLNKKINKKENIILNNIIEIKKNIDITNNSLIIEKINLRLDKFTSTHKKKYLNKIDNEDWIILEYEDKYEWFINKKNFNIKEEFEKLFKEYESVTLILDNIKWRKFENAKEEDYKSAKKIKIVVKKY